MGPERSKEQQFYRYTDADGRIHVVSSPDSLPPEARAKAERVELKAGETRQEQSASPAAPAFELQGLSFGLGFAAALLLAVVYRFMPQNMRWLPRLAVVVGLTALGTGLYLGYLRQSTGAGTSPLAAPSALIQDAKDAVELVEQRRRDQEADLRALKTEGDVVTKPASSK